VNGPEEPEAYDIVAIVFGITIVSIPVPLIKLYPREFNAGGRISVLRLVQLLNALAPIDVTLSGMATLVKLTHPENTELLILVTLYPSRVLGMTTSSPAPVYLVIVATLPETVYS
jgi:hypothetical protein